MVDKDDVAKAKDDKRLPMQAHSTPMIVFAADGEQARTVAGEIAKNAFHSSLARRLPGPGKRK